MADRQFVAPFGDKAVPADWILQAALEIMPKMVWARFDGSAATNPFRPCLRIISDSGHVAAEAVSDTIVAAGGSADVSWFRDVDQVPEQSLTAGVALEAFFFDSILPPTSPVYSSTVLASGQPYVVTVQGDYTQWNQALTLGNPQPNAVYPGSTAGRVSTQVGVDAECCFANNPGPTAFPVGQHVTAFEIDLGSGFSHREPVGGPYSTPQSGWAYTYQLTGQGSQLGVRINATPSTDNYGKLLITIQGSSGGGSLVPPTNAGNNGQVMLTAGGVAAWGNVDGGSP